MEMIAHVVRGAHTALEFERKEKQSSPWHDIVAITHQVPMEEVVDEQGRVLPLLDEHPDQERLYVFTLNRGFTPNRTEIAWVQRARVQGRRLLYIAESDDVVVPASFPPAPLVAASPREIIAEAVRVWARAAMDASAGRDLYLPESGINLRPDADEAALTGSLRVVNGLLIERLRRVPELMHQLHPRAFEELVAELLAARGYDVTLTPFSGDGGRDILAVSHDDLGEFLIYVECKKWDPHHLVGPDVVRALYGVVAADNVTAGVVATTSSFSPGAREFERQIAHRVALRDFFDLSAWLRDHRLG
jgi:restriction endonuclease Mrr